MSKTPLVLVAALLALTGCAPAPAAPPTPKPTATATPSPTGMYGKRLRLVPSDPSATFACRALTANERNMTQIRYRVSAPSPAAAVEVAEGWSLVAWKHKGETLAFLTNGKPYDWGTSYQAIPTGGSWRGTHTNMGIALEDGPRALDAALQCIG